MHNFREIYSITEIIYYIIFIDYLLTFFYVPPNNKIIMEFQKEVI